MGTERSQEQFKKAIAMARHEQRKKDHAYLERAMKENEEEFKRRTSEEMKNYTADKPDNVYNVQNVRSNEGVIDAMILGFSEIVRHQQEKVLKSGKYEHPVHPLNHTAMEWVFHQREEIADAMVYQETLKQTIEEVVELIQKAKAINDAGVCGASEKQAVTHLLDKALSRLY